MRTSFSMRCALMLAASSKPQMQNGANFFPPPSPGEGPLTATKTSAPLRGWAAGRRWFSSSGSQQPAISTPRLLSDLLTDFTSSNPYLSVAEIRRAGADKTMKEIDKSNDFGRAFHFSKMQACAQDFAPFPENGDEARDRFIVDLAYERGCVLNDHGVEVNASVDQASESRNCETEVLDMQAMTNAQLNAKCRETASFPDMCAGCLDRKNLRHVGECNQMTLTERKDTIISELQRLDGNTTAFPESALYQRMSPDALIKLCAGKTFTDWCAVMKSCGGPQLRHCAQLSQRDKKNAFIHLARVSAVLAKDGVVPTVAALQNETDAALKARCGGMSLIQQSHVESVEEQVALARAERVSALQDRHSRLEKVAGLSSKSTKK